MTKTSEPAVKHFPPLRIAAAAGVLVLLALPLLPVPEFWITQLDYIGLYAVVVLGLVLLTGVAGLTSFGQAAFVGLGAYASAWVTTAHAASPWLGLLCAIQKSGTGKAGSASMAAANKGKAQRRSACVINVPRRAGRAATATSAPGESTRTRSLP